MESCEIEEFIENLRCKLRVMLRSRVVLSCHVPGSVLLFSFSLDPPGGPG